MKTIQVDQTIVDHLLSHATSPAETPAQILRRELRMLPPQVALEIDDDTYAFILAKARGFGESASDILRRELNLSTNPDEPTEPADPHAPPETGPETLLFSIPAGTGSNSWNSRDTTLVARKGDTLRIINEDTVPHRLHTPGRPFQHADNDTLPGQSSDFLLLTTFDPVQEGPLYDHNHGAHAHFWLRVVDNG
ncbi:MAG: hypothetical protein V4628_10410 [Pseudomonadota bacterium]